MLQAFAAETWCDASTWYPYQGLPGKIKRKNSAFMALVAFIWPFGQFYSTFLMLIESGKKSSNFDFVIILDYFMPLLQEAHMDLRWLEFGVGPILTSGPTEIEALGTLGMSHGTKLLAPKNFSYHAQLMLFYVFLWFVLQKMLKSRLIWIFCFSLNKRMA